MSFNSPYFFAVKAMTNLSEINGTRTLNCVARNFQLPAGSACDATLNNYWRRDGKSISGNAAGNLIQLRAKALIQLITWNSASKSAQVMQKKPSNYFTLRYRCRSAIFHHFPTHGCGGCILMKFFPDTVSCSRSWLGSQSICRLCIIKFTLSLLNPCHPAQ